MPFRGSSDYYSDVSWFVRAMRAVPVIAGAALLGGFIGGFAVFAVDSALNWEPAPQARPEPRADSQTAAPASAQTNASSQAIAVEQRKSKPVRVVGGAIPDPSAGMSAPPPAAQPQRSSAPAQPELSSQLLVPKPLGPATQLQPPTATASSVTQTQNQPVSQTNQSSPQTQNATAAQREPWPDALSRAHQDALNAQGQSAPPPTAQSSGANNNSEVDRKAADSNRAATADNQDRLSGARHGRHTRQRTLGANGWRNGGEVSTTPSSRRQDARSYDRDRLYDSYSNRRDRSYGSRRGPSYGDVAPQPGPEPYRGGGFFGRSRGFYSDDY